MKKLSKVLLVLFMALSMAACKDKSPEGKYEKEQAEIEEDYAEAAREDDIVKAYAKGLKAYIKEEQLKQTAQNFNDVIKQIEDGGIDSLKAIVNKISDMFDKLTGEEEVEIDAVLAVYGVTSAIAMFEDQYENEPILELCEKFNDYIEKLVKDEDASEEELKITLYLDVISRYTDEDYTNLYNKIIGK